MGTNGVGIFDFLAVFMWGVPCKNMASLGEQYFHLNGARMLFNSVLLGRNNTF